MHLLAISGSLRANSTNTALLRALIALAPTHISTTLYNDLDRLPHFSPERDTDPAPEAVASLRQQIQAADAILICTPEYIHSIPGTLKNMLDWLASSGSFVHKRVGVISASPSDMGGSRAHAMLTYTLGILMAQLPEAASLTVPFVKQRLSPTGDVTDPSLTESLREVLQALIATDSPQQATV